MKQLLICLLMALLACENSTKQIVVDENEIVEEDVDADNDGYLGDEDCDETSSLIHLGAPEVCDGLDNDCDGEIDEGVLSTYYLDEDHDNFGNPEIIEMGCWAPENYVSVGSDCDDENEEIFPGAMEVCDDLDNDCNDEIDEGLGNIWYPDLDSDGYGATQDALQTCNPPGDYIDRGGDCNDSLDTIFPGAVEECDGLDNNCNGEVDETGSLLWYLDADVDGYGDPAVFFESCTAPQGFVGNNLDCDDLDSNFSPDSVEICDSIDNNCNGILDENAIDGDTWYIDTDSDGFGDIGTTILACTQPIGYSGNSNDCDDSRFETSPVALEFCNGIDDNCDGITDGSDVVDFQVYFTDSDGDGYGDPLSPVQSCSIGIGVVSNNLDCNDGDAVVFPYATEYCNGIDDNCNTVIDEVAVDQGIYYLDADGDGYGSTISELACAGSVGYITQTGDCDDSNAGVNPSAIEICDAMDNDCDGGIDEVIPTTVWYIDNDGDSYGNGALSTYNCLQPSGYVSNSEDCDDSDLLVNPAQTEICNGIDDDCDGDFDAGILGMDMTCVAESCLEILNAHPTVGDDEYFIEFPSGIELAQCDMGSFGGGWTQVFVDDMNPPDSGWSLQQTYNCGIWGTILGGYGIISNGSVNNTISTRSIPHAELWVEFDYIALDSWDFSGQTGLGPDFAYANFNNTSILYSDFDNHLSIYGEVCGWNRGYYGSYDSRLYVSSIQAGTFTDFDLTIGSTLNQGPWDESFGFDDVYVWVR